MGVEDNKLELGEVSVVTGCAVTGLLASTMTMLLVREVISIVLAGESVSVVSRL